MALSIKDPETERLARRLADATGETITAATRRALEERLRRFEGPARKAALLEEMAEIRARVSAMPELDDRTAEESSAMTSTDCRADGDRYLGNRGHHIE